VRFSPPAGWVDALDAHGTTTGYRYGCRCEECRAANTAQGREGRVRRAAALARLADQLPHGSKATYTNYGCQCDACVAAQAAANRRRRR
jgi:hypothetical protein